MNNTILVAMAYRDDTKRQQESSKNKSDISFFSLKVLTL